MNGRSQMQGGKNWILPKLINANHWLEIWKNHLCPSMGPNGGSVAMDSEENYSTMFTVLYFGISLVWLSKNCTEIFLLNQL
jgi:hypothetical protein